MQIRFALAARDYFAVAWLLWRRQWSVLEKLIQFVAIVAIACGVSARHESHPWASGNIAEHALWCGIGFFSFYFCQITSRFWLVKTTIGGDPESVGAETSLRISPEGVTRATPSQQAQYAWSRFTGVKITDRYVLLEMVRDQVLFVPARCFFDNKQVYEFAAQAEELREQARFAKWGGLNMADFRQPPG